MHCFCDTSATLLPLRSGPRIRHAASVTVTGDRGDHAAVRRRHGIRQTPLLSLSGGMRVGADVRSRRDCSPRGGVAGAPAPKGLAVSYLIFMSPKSILTPAALRASNSTVLAILHSGFPFKYSRRNGANRFSPSASALTAATN